MTDAFWTALFSNLPGVIGSAAVGVPAVMAAYMTWRNGQRADAASKVAVAARSEIKATVASMDTKVNDIHQQTQTIVANSGLGPITEPGALK